MSKIKFDRDYKQSIQEGFLADYTNGLSDKQLGDKYFLGHCYAANHFVRYLRDAELIERGPRPRPDTAPAPYDVFEPCEASLDLTTPTADLYRAKANIHRGMLREKNRTTALQELLREQVSALPPLEIPSFSTHAPEKRIAALLLSDLQPGMLVDMKDSSGLEMYSTGIFHERVERLVEHLDREITMLRSGSNIDTLEISFLGDGPEGETMFPNQGIYTDSPTVDQLVECRVGIGKILGWAASVFPQVRYRSNRGNHGRPGMKGVNHARTNWDDILGEFLRLEWRDQKNIEFLLSASNEMLYEIPELPGYHFLNVHGQYLPKKNLRSARDSYSGLWRQPIDFVFMAHYHEPTMNDMPHGVAVINGAFSGGTEHSISGFRAANSPKQLLLTFTEHEGLKSRHDLYLDGGRMHRLTKDERGVFTPLSN